MPKGPTHFDIKKKRAVAFNSAPPPREMKQREAYETEVSAEGNNDRTSLEKDVLAVATPTYGVE